MPKGENVGNMLSLMSTHVKRREIRIWEIKFQAQEEESRSNMDENGAETLEQVLRSRSSQMYMKHTWMERALENLSSGMRKSENGLLV